jgi:polyadenylate-binding protein
MADAPPPAAARQEEVTTTPAASAPAEPVPASGESQPALAAVPALYVGDLHEDVKDEDLFDAFTKVGTVTSVRLCRDNITNKSLRYGYVNYFSRDDGTGASSQLRSRVKSHLVRAMGDVGYVHDLDQKFFRTEERGRDTWSDYP